MDAADLLRYATEHLVACNVNINMESINRSDWEEIHTYCF